MHTSPLLSHAQYTWSSIIYNCFIGPLSHKSEDMESWIKSDFLNHLWMNGSLSCCMKVYTPDWRFYTFSNFGAGEIGQNMGEIWCPRAMGQITTDIFFDNTLHLSSKQDWHFLEDFYCLEITGWQSHCWFLLCIHRLSCQQEVRKNVNHAFEEETLKKA